MTFRQTYAEAQTDLTIVTPISGTKIYIWQVTIKSDGASDLTFSVSDDTIAELTGQGVIGINNPDKEGDFGESIVLNCATNTTVSILYDEVE